MTGLSLAIFSVRHQYPGSGDELMVGLLARLCVTERGYIYGLHGLGLRLSFQSWTNHVECSRTEPL